MSYSSLMLNPSNNVDYATPKLLMDTLQDAGYIDVVTFKDINILLDKTYHRCKLYFNPPFESNSVFLDYAMLQSLDNEILFLMPVRTDTKYFHNLLSMGILQYIFFYRGRMHFNDDSRGAPFPVMLLKFGTKKYDNPIVLYGGLNELVKLVKGGVL